MKVKGALKMVNSPQTLGARIRAVRKAWGWTQEDLAKALKTDRQIVSYWERDVSKPSRPAMQLLASLFQMSSDSLSTGVGFTIPDAPQDVETGREKGIRHALPAPRVGKVALVVANSEKSQIISFEKAVETLKDAEANGQLVWLVLGNEPL